MSATARTTNRLRAQARDQGRVLLITEEPGDGAYRRLLEDAGFVVAGVEGSAAALVALQRARPHVVVAETRLKGISAQELARALSEAQDAVPIVLIGREVSDAARRLEAIASGAFDYVQMPGEQELLVARARQLVAQRQLVERLRAEADRDYLTGLANRRRFRNALGKEVERWRRYGVPCALVLLDVDHMKRINDSHGHPAGDRVIRAVAGSLQELSRDNDTAARLGGEEFALLLAGTDGPQAHAAAERLRLAVSAQRVEAVGAVTISLGVAACPSHAATERELYAASDAALYRAKREGRDRTVLAGSQGKSEGQLVGDLSGLE